MNLHITYFYESLGVCPWLHNVEPLINTETIYTLFGSAILEGLLQILDDSFQSSPSFHCHFNHCLHYR